MNRIERFKQKLAALKPHQLEIIDESHMHAGHFENNNVSGTHLRIKIVSDLFENKTKLARHKIINNLLKEEFDNGLHALGIHAFTIKELK